MRLAAAVLAASAFAFSPCAALAETQPFVDAVPDGGPARDDGPAPVSDAGQESRLRGGACLCASSPGASALALFAVALLALRTRRRRAAALLLFLALLPLAARAQRAPDVQLFRPTTPESPYLSTEGSRILAPGQVSLGFVIDYSRDALIRFESGAKSEDVLRDRFSGDFAATFGVYGPLQVGIALPVALPRGSTTDHGALATAAVGDLRIIPKVRAFASRVVRLAFAADLTLPSGDADSFMGDTGVTFAPRFVLELGSEDAAVRGALNLGYRFRRAVRIEDWLYDDEIFYRAALAFRPHPRIDLVAEIAGATSAVRPFHHEIENPLEGSVAARFGLGRGVSLLAGVGAGLLPGAGAPSVRGFLGVGYAPGTATPSGPDVVVTATPRGKPGDRDGDGVPDDQDRCPDEPGPAKLQGCPDSDGDGIPDIDDQCPLEPAGPHGAPDGCPRFPDRDGDGIPDHLDACPDLPGPVKFQGCPDSDGDGIPDHLDRCPFEPEDPDGFADEDGCPDHDNDFDGIPDAVDPDPLEPQPPPDLRRVPLPEAAQKAVRFVKKKMLLMDKVRFVRGTPKLRAQAAAVLDRVATIVKAHDILKLRIDGHVEALPGRTRAALARLSEQMAEVVRAELVRRGVEADRLTVFGYGSRHPALPPGTKGAAEANRRVEFVVVEQ